VLRDRLHADRKRRSELADGCVAVREPFEDRAPRRIGERGKRVGELVDRQF